MKLEVDRKELSAIHATIILVLISLIVAVFVAYFFGSLLGQW